MDGNYRNMGPHVDRLWTDDLELYAAAEAVDDLLSHPGWDAVQRILLAELAQVDAKLDHGRDPLTQAEYALAHGRRGGLKASVEARLAIKARAAKRMADAAKHEDTAESVSGR